MSFVNNTHQTRHIGYLLSKVKRKDHNNMINGQNVFDQPVKNDTRTYNILKITTGQGDYCTTGCLLDFPCLKKLQVNCNRFI